MARAHISVALRRRGGNISVDLSLFVLLYNSNFMNKPKFKDSLQTVKFFYNLQNRHTFHSEDRLVNLERGRECFVCLSMLLVYVYSKKIKRGEGGWAVRYWFHVLYSRFPCPVSVQYTYDIHNT